MSNILRPVDPTEEKNFSEMLRLGQITKTPIPFTRFSAVARDPNGRVTMDFESRSHTVLRNAYNLFGSWMCGWDLPAANYGAGYLGIGTGTGSSPTVSAKAFSDNDLMDFIPPDSSAYGIIVGYNSVGGGMADTFEAFTLNGPFGEGSYGDGSITHGAQTAITPIYHASSSGSIPARTWEQPYSRVFTNSNTTIQTIYEIGLQGHWRAGSANVLLYRDVVSPGWAVAANGGTITIGYSSFLSYP